LANLGWIAVAGAAVPHLVFVALPLAGLTGMPALVLARRPALLDGLMLVGILFIIRNGPEIIELPTILSHVPHSPVSLVSGSLRCHRHGGKFHRTGLIIEPQLEHLSLFGVVIVIIGAVVFLIGHP
jgi:hypothetical protein